MHYRENIMDIELNNSTGVARTMLNYTIGMSDDEANRFGVRLFRAGEPVALNYVTVEGFFRDPHGNNIFIDGGVVRNGNEAYVTLPQACYNYDGQFTLAIKIVGSDITGTMRIIDGTVLNTNTSGAVAPTDSVPTYQEIISIYDTMVAMTEDIPGLINTVDQHTTQISTLNTTVSGHTTRLNSLESAVSDLNDDVSENQIAIKANIPNMLTSVTWTTGKYIDIDGEIKDSADMCYSSLITLTHPNDYVAIFKALQELHTFRVHGYDKDGNWVRQLGSISSQDQTLNETGKITFAAGDCKYVRLSLCTLYAVYMAQSVDDKILSETLQSMVNTFGMAERKNLLEDVTWTEYAWINSNGEISTTHEQAAFSKASALIPVVMNKRYYLTFVQKANRPVPEDIRIFGYDENGDFVRIMRIIPGDEQTSGDVSVESFWVRDNVSQIRICMRDYVFACLSVSNDLDETVTESLYDDSTMDWVVGGINWVNGEDTSNAARIRTDGWANLAADFIRGENIKIALFVYDRDTSFKGVWNGHGLDSGRMTWFDFINMREVHKVLDRLYPNFIYKMTARGPGTETMTTGFGPRVHFYIRKIQYASIGAYLTWAVVGASSDNGWFGGHDNPDYAWPLMLARRVGNTVTNYSKGGRTLKAFINDTSSTGLAQLLSDPAAEFYTITLGGNDASGSGDIGTIADITGYTDWHNYPDTVYGNYGKIVEQIMAHAPNAKLVLTTPPGANYSERQSAVDNAVREIAGHYQVPYIEWEHDPFMSSNVFTKNLVGNHPTKVLYSGKALAFERLFSECVAKNTAYFA